jgi:hypothetical protein
MPTLRPPALLLLVCLLAPSRAEAHPEAPGQAKAPVALTLSAAPSGDTLTLSLTIEATADIPRAVARFALPKGLTPLSGPASRELGPLAGGERVTASLRVRQLTKGEQQQVFAGVDCHMASGVRLHAAASWPPAVSSKVSPERPRAGLRATPARRRP